MNAFKITVVAYNLPYFELNDSIVIPTVADGIAQGFDFIECFEHKTNQRWQMGDLVSQHSKENDYREDLMSDDDE
jgi:hypothetical protein